MDEKLFEQPEESQEPSRPQGEDPEQRRAEIREAEHHGEEQNPPGEIPPTGSRGDWT
jgi:hypothetical protein